MLRAIPGAVLLADPGPAFCPAAGPMPPGLARRQRRWRRAAERRWARRGGGGARRPHPRLGRARGRGQTRRGPGVRTPPREVAAGRVRGAGGAGRAASLDSALLEAAMPSLWRDVLLETLLGKPMPPAARVCGAGRGRLSPGGRKARSVFRIEMLIAPGNFC